MVRILDLSVKSIHSEHAKKQEPISNRLLEEQEPITLLEEAKKE